MKHGTRQDVLLAIYSRRIQRGSESTQDAGIGRLAAGFPQVESLPDLQQTTAKIVSGMRTVDTPMHESFSTMSITAIIFTKNAVVTTEYAVAAAANMAKSELKTMTMATFPTGLPHWQATTRIQKMSSGTMMIAATIGSRICRSEQRIGPK